MGLPGSEDKIVWTVSTQYERVTDGQTDRRTDDRRPAYINNMRSMTDAR